jgi:hypothetical protein
MGTFYTPLFGHMSRQNLARINVPFPMQWLIDLPSLL